jgi:hypothetical protein
MSSPQQPPPPNPQASQAGLAILIGLAIARLWPSLDLLHLRQSLPAFKAAVFQEVQRHAQASATLAVQQYSQQRVMAGVGAGFTPRPAAPPVLEQVSATVDWAVQPLWDSAVALQQLDAAPPETQQVAGSAIADAKARLAAAAERQVLDTGWSTVTDAVLRDRKAKGYARIPEPGACSFCGMLSARGIVYKADSFDAAKAKFKANADFPDADRAHNYCRCHLEPIWTAYEPSADVRSWTKLYDDTARKIGYGTTAGVTADDMRVAFRQAFEGRPIDLERSRALRAKRKGESPRNTPKSSDAGPADGRTQDQISAELTALEKNFSRLTNDKQREWTNTRMAELRTQLGQ